MARGWLSRRPKPATGGSCQGPHGRRRLGVLLKQRRRFPPPALATFPRHRHTRHTTRRAAAAERSAVSREAVSEPRAAPYVRCRRRARFPCAPPLGFPRQQLGTSSPLPLGDRTFDARLQPGVLLPPAGSQRATGVRSRIPHRFICGSFVELSPLQGRRLRRGLPERAFVSATGSGDPFPPSGVRWFQ